MPNPSRLEHLTNITTNRPIQATKSPSDFGTPRFGYWTHRRRVSPKTQIQQNPIAAILIRLMVQLEISMIVASHFFKDRQKRNRNHIVRRAST